jgi:thiol-disulfide isomerase/thioredoxin
MNLRDELPTFEGASAWINREGDKEVLVEGKPTLIHFWSTSCHLCKLVMPKLNKLFETFQDKLNVVSVHIPRTDTDFNLEKVKEVAAQFNMTQPILVDNDLLLRDAFENQYVPAYYIFDSERKLRHFQAGGDGILLLVNRLERILRKT